MFYIKAELLSGRNANGGPYRLPSALLTFATDLTEWKPFWLKTFMPRYLEQVQQNFETEGGLVGGWPGLNPQYAAWKARHFPGTKILERTRRLRNSLVPGATGDDTVIQAGPLNFRVGTRVPAGRFVVAKRPFLPPIKIEDWTPAIREFVRSLWFGPATSAEIANMR